jgi:hypothetical protein
MALDLGFEERGVYVLRAIEINGDRGVDRPEQMHVKVVIAVARRHQVCEVAVSGGDALRPVLVV